MDYEAFFAGHLRRLHDEGRYRVFAELERIAGALPARAASTTAGTAPATSPSGASNDYLGMGQHPAVLEAMHAAIDALRRRRRRHPQHLRHQPPCTSLLERELADLHGKEAALVFTSGYVANEATLQTLGAPAARAARSSPTR